MKKRKTQPMQPIVWDGQGVIRFQANEIVRYLLDNGGLDLNKLHGMGHPAPNFPREDWEQFAQLIGYSVSGFGDLGYPRRHVVAKADEIADRLARRGGDPALRKRGKRTAKATAKEGA